MTYDKLPFIPSIIAESVCRRPYRGCELSGYQATNIIEKVEELRKNMTDEQVREFSEFCDSKCRLVFDVKSPWFLKLARARGNKGRDQLSEVWFPHWMVSWLLTYGSK